MAIRTVKQLLTKFHQKKLELLVKTIPINDNINFLNKYSKVLENYQVKTVNDAVNFVNFPCTAFNTFPNETYKNLILVSFNMVKDNNNINSFVYDTILENLCQYNINFNVEYLLSEMKDRNIKYNHKTYSNLINIYCKTGEMKKAEEMVEIFKSMYGDISYKNQLNMISGYIIAGQLFKADDFILQCKLDKNALDALLYKAKGYAILGNSSEVMKIVNSIKENHMKHPDLVYLDLYKYLVLAKARDSNVQLIFDMISEIEFDNKILNSIYYLNRFGYYNNSLQVVKKFESVLTDNPDEALNLIISFNTADCPLNVYKTILGKFLNYSNTTFNSIFCYTSFDEAISFAETRLNHENRKSIIRSLFSKAISEKSNIYLQKIIECGLLKSMETLIQSELQFIVIPLLLENGLVTDCKHFVELLTDYQSVILPVTLMYTLSHRDLEQFDNLFTSYKKPKNLSYLVDLHKTSNIILNNYELNDFNMLKLKAEEVFHPSLIMELFSQIIIKTIISFSRNNDDNQIIAAVKFAENHKLMFNETDFNKMNEFSEIHSTLVKPLYSRIKKQKSEILDDQILSGL